MKRGKKPEWQRRIAKERIEILFKLAEEEFKKHPERSRRYIQLARKIGLRYNIRLSKSLKRKFCKKCNSLLIPGFSSEVKIKSREKVVEVKCLNCGNVKRYPYSKKFKS